MSVNDDNGRSKACCGIPPVSAAGGQLTPAEVAGVRGNSPTGSNLVLTQAQLQPYTAVLNALLAITPNAGTFIRGNGTTWEGATFVGQFGRGLDGSLVSSSGTTTLTSSKQYTTVTLTSTAILVTDGYPITVNGVLTNSAVIRDNGNNASGTTGGAALAAQGIRPITGAGSNGRNDTGVGTAGGATGTSYWAAENGTTPGGGTGGSASGNAGGNGGAGPTSIITAITSWTIGSFAGVVSAVNAIRRLGGGGGGGSGGNAPGAGTAVSGGGGGGGGVVHVLARVLTGSGIFEAKGGAGGNGAQTGAGVAGAGGGGGGGHVLVLAGQLVSWTGSASAAGGASGTGANGGGNGTAGTDGATVLITMAV